jgi:putative hydrolase of the HAD superfamily
LEGHDSVRYVLFDLDETIYAKDTGLMKLVSQRITDYMTLRLGIDPETVQELRRKYYEEYGTTGRGFFLHHPNLDVEDYFFFVHDLSVEQFLEPNHRLDEMLEDLDAEKVIFTNATAEHARRVLRALTIDRHFQSIIDIRHLGYIPKPAPEAYLKALALLGAHPDECMMVEDRLRNLKPGQELGMTTVLIGNERVADGADFVLEDITQVGELFRQIRSQGTEK